MLLPPTTTSLGAAGAAWVKIGATRAVARATVAIRVFMLRLLCGCWSVSLGCISVRPGGQRLLTVKCHRHLRADVMRITLAAVSSRLPAYWRKLLCYKYIDITN